MRINARLGTRGVTFMVIAALFATVALVLVAPDAIANHGTAGLDARPETATRGVGTEHTITAHLVTRTPCLPDQCTPAPRTATSGAVTINFENENGVNDPDAGTSLDTPDRQCSLAGTQTSCSISYVGTKMGNDVWRVWIDHTLPDTSEGRDETLAPGTSGSCEQVAGTEPEPEPDCTDVVQVTWVAGPPARLDCDDQTGPDTERELNPSGGPDSNEVYNCFVTDEFGNPVADADPNTSGTQNIIVRGEVENGTNDPDPDDGPSYESPDYSCTVSQGGSGNPPLGQCNITVTQNELEQGTAVICFWIGEGEGEALCSNEPTGEDQQADGSDTGNDRADQVEKSWGQVSSPAAGGLDAEPETDTNPTGQNHVITATVYDQFGQPFFADTQIKLEFFEGSPSDTDGNTPATPDKTCQTGADSPSCSITYTSSSAGADLACLWHGADPVMSGNNTSNPTCNGEVRDDPDDDAAGQDAPQPENDRIDVVQKTWTQGPGGEPLDCTPETASNPTGTSHTVTCTVTDAQNERVSGAFVDFEVTGANDPDAGDTPASPDFSCTTVADDPQTTTNEAGTCSIIHGAGTQSTETAGTTTYRAWIDSDNANSTTEADATEGRDEVAAPGTTPEPDGTDVVEKTWTGDGGAARTIDCEPETSTNPTGSQHEVTCTVRDSSNLPVEGESVTFTESGPGAFVGDTVKTTDNTGRVRATTTSNERGTQTITGTITQSTQNEPDVDECNRPANDPQGAPAGQCSDDVTKNWGSTPRGECARAGAILGTDGNDVLVGTEGNDVICGFAGNDTIRGLGGDDILLGHSDDDTLEGGAGADTMKGSVGKDVLEGANGKDVLRGGKGGDSLKGNRGHDTLRGGRGHDTLRGGRGNDTLRGGRGNDSCRDAFGQNIFRSCERR